jgi:flagellar motility protein MotE (MotC chaperone)
VLAADAEATADAVRSKGSRADVGDGSEIEPGGGRFRVPALSRGVESILDQVRKREIALVLREQSVAERERAVVELEQRIDQRARELDRIRAEVEDRIHAWASQGGDRVAQLAKVYAEMPEAKAGSLLGRLELDLAVSIIRQMKKKSSAGVLAAMGSDRALLVSERLLKPLDPTTDAPAAAQP